MLSASDPEGLDVEKQVSASVEQLPQSATFEELLEVSIRAVAKLNLDWPDGSTDSLSPSPVLSLSPH